MLTSLHPTVPCTQSGSLTHSRGAFCTGGSCAFESASSSRLRTLEAGRGLLTASLSLLAQSLALSGHCSAVCRMCVSLDILTARKPEATGELTGLGAQRRQAPVSSTAAAAEAGGCGRLGPEQL